LRRPRLAAAVVASLSPTILFPAVGEQSAPPPASRADSAAIFVTRQQLANALKASIESHSDPALSPIGVNDQYSINEVHRSGRGAPAIHPGWTEVHFILDGSATFVTGGTIMNSSSTQPIIEGGVSRAVNKGDAIIIPPDTPHWYKHIEGTLTYLEVRFIAPR